MATHMQPEMASRLSEMVPTYTTSEGAFEIGSESIYIHGVTPLRETDLSDFTAFRGLANCMRPLPIIPANLCPERSDPEIVTTRVHSGGEDGSLSVEVTNVTTSSVATSLLAPQVGDDDSDENQGIREFNRALTGGPVLEQIAAEEVDAVNAAMSEASATTPRSFEQSNLGLTATDPDASMDRTSARGTPGPSSCMSEAAPNVTIPDPNPENLSTIIVQRQTPLCQSQWIGTCTGGSRLQRNNTCWKGQSTQRLSIILLS